MPVSCSVRAPLSLYFGFIVITATPWVEREVLGASSALLKMMARPSVENAAISSSSVSWRMQTSGLLSD